MHGFFVQLVVVLLTARLLALLLRRLGQPVVVAEMTAGFVLGPAALGAISTSAFEWLVSAKVALDVLGQIGLILFMFVVGAELTTAGVSRARTAGSLVAVSAVAVPALLALALAPWVYEYAPDGVGFWQFASFFCLAIATTAVPVMARLLQERGELGSTEGAVSLSAAAFGDVVVWLALPLIVGLSKAPMDESAALKSIGALVALTAVALYGVRPLLAAWWRRVPDDAPIAAVVGPPLVCAVVFAASTHAIGFHAVFGAFLAGLCMPGGAGLLRKLDAAITPVSTLVLIPCFFASAGLQTLPVTSAGLGALLSAIVVVAVVGKLVGGAIGMRFAGYGWGASAKVGVLMNIRGMMELVVITIGFQAGLIGSEMFTALFLMAIITTAMASPMLAAVSALQATAGSRAAQSGRAIKDPE